MTEAQTLLPSSGITVIADSRESNSNVTRHLKELGADVRENQLKVGDYICSDRVGVERKRISDFLQSIIDQRVFKQVEELSNSFETPLLILEGNPESLFLERDIHENAIRGVLSSIAIDYRMPIIWTINSRETANQIYWIANREQALEKRGLQIRASKKAPTLARQQEYLVAGLPGINSVRAKKLLKQFRSPEKVFKANEEKLKKVNGFGDKTAKSIRNLLTKPYKK